MGCWGVCTHCDASMLLQGLEKSLEQTETQLAENGDRIGIMSEHLNNVQQEIKYTQSRVRTMGAAPGCMHAACRALPP